MSTYLRYFLQKDSDRCKLAPVNIAKTLRDQLARSGRTAANVSKAATGQKDAIKRILDGHSPSIDRAEKIAHALGLEFYIGPPREAKSGQMGGSLSTFGDAGEAGPGLAPVRDRQLAEVLAIIADHYERENEYGRNSFLAELKAWRPALFAGARAAPGHRLARLAGGAGRGGPKAG